MHKAAPARARRATAPATRTRTFGTREIVVPVPTVRAIAEQYLEDLRSRDVPAKPDSIRSARAALERLQSKAGLHELEQVTKPAITAWQRARILAGASNRTANLEISHLSAALNLAARLGQIDVNPLAGLEALPTSGRHRRRIGRPLLDDEIAQLLEGAARVDQAARFPFARTPTLEGLLMTGARWNEMRQIEWGDVDVDAGALTLRAETTKSGIERTIPLDAGELARLLEMREGHARSRGRSIDASTPVFVSATGLRWDRCPSNFRRFLHAAMVAAGLARTDRRGRVLHVHALRKTAATRWARAGMPLLDLQRILGHTDPKLTAQIYIDAGLEVGRRWISSLPRRASGGMKWPSHAARETSAATFESRIGSDGATR